MAITPSLSATHTITATPQTAETEIAPNTTTSGPREPAPPGIVARVSGSFSGRIQVSEGVGVRVEALQLRILREIWVTMSAMMVILLLVGQALREFSSGKLISVTRLTVSRLVDQLTTVDRSRDVVLWFPNHGSIAPGSLVSREGVSPSLTTMGAGTKCFGRRSYCQRTIKPPLDAKLWEICHPILQECGISKWIEHYQVVLEPAHRLIVVSRKICEILVNLKWAVLSTPSEKGGGKDLGEQIHHRRSGMVAVDCRHQVEEGPPLRAPSM
ncbi:hypothetical protein Syun_000935 [Stephania yunnanensis]|uniref:Uncharacterized protein n=1 Tax=Stephania yunnanensis TaxID=152371 RepID=A0AAP0LFN7_9MAGN